MSSTAWSGRRQRELEEIGLHPSRQFCAIVDRERALVDRNEHMFALLVFDMSEFYRNWLNVRAFATVGAARLRKTDMMGWLDARRTGILLPFTNYAGAKRVADAMTSELAEEGMSVACIVHTYPAVNEQRGNDSLQLSFVGLDPAIAQWSGASSTTLGAGPSLPSRTERRERTQAPAAPESALKAMILPPFPRWKRLMDIGISLILLVLASPAMLAIALMIKLVSPRGSVMFKQERIGFLGNRFTCFKFRSMHMHSEEAVHQRHLQHLMQSNVPMTKLDAKNDPRVIPLGRLLRASGLDELPQIFNVLRGDMSLIGPRPCLNYEYASFAQWHRTRCDTMPGITGLWQVSGKNRTTFTEMMRLDVSYARRHSVRKDLKILIMTIPAVMKQVTDLVGFQKR